MIDKLVDMIDGVVKQSSESYKINGPKCSNSRWLYCVALADRGWKAYGYETPESTDTNDDVIIKWRKEGEVEIKVRLSFTEQCLWLRHLEKKENKNVPTE